MVRSNASIKLCKPKLYIIRHLRKKSAVIETDSCICEISCKMLSSIELFILEINRFWSTDLNDY